MNNKIKIFILKTVAFSLIFSAILYFYFLICLKYSNTPVPTEWENVIFSKKDEIANNIDGRKIVLLGGSNVLYGISAEIIEKNLNIPTVNYGTRAGLKYYIFEKAKRILKPGDIVIFENDYPLYFYNKKIAFGRQTNMERYILTHDQEYYNNLNIFEKFNIVVVGLENLTENMQTTFQKQPYRYDTINNFGDETSNTMDNIKDNIVASNIINLTNDFKKEINYSYGTKEIVKFINYCKKNNIKLYATFPAIADNKDYREDNYKEFFSIIYEIYLNKDIPTIGKPEDFLFNIKLFFDGPSHLNAEGRKFKTDFIVDFLNFTNE